MTDVLVFLTFVYIYTTNGSGLGSTITRCSPTASRGTSGRGRRWLTSPAIYFLMVFTWLVATTVGLAGESLSRAAGGTLALVGSSATGVSAAIVWGSMAGLRPDPGRPPGAALRAGRRIATRTS